MSSGIKKIDYWCTRHGQAFFSSLNRFKCHFWGNLITVIVIGVALALPAILYVLLQNVEALGQGWNNNAQITLFLKQNVTAEQALNLTTQLQTQPDIQKVTYISPTIGLKQLEHQFGFEQALSQLSKNPLPGVLVVKPALKITTSFAVHQLLNQLKLLPQVDMAQLDMAWVKKFFSVLNLIRHGLIALAFLFALLVVLVVGNTIRLLIQNQRDEIEVAKLVGAKNAFVRRPFLYTGALYGFLGALIAYVLVYLLLIWLSEPVAQLARLYHSSFTLQGFSLFSTEMLFLAGMVLGLLGAWLAVSRQLKQIDVI